MYRRILRYQPSTQLSLGGRETRKKITPLLNQLQRGNERQRDDGLRPAPLSIRTSRPTLFPSIASNACKTLLDSEKRSIKHRPIFGAFSKTYISKDPIVK